jgi:hypothetical protein
MLYSYIVKKGIRKTFDHVDNHRWDEVLKPVAPNVHLKVNSIWVKGWPWHSTVFAQWDGNCLYGAFLCQEDCVDGTFVPVRA